MDLDLPPDPKVDEIPRAPDLWAALALTAQMHGSAAPGDIVALLGYAVAALGPFAVQSNRPQDVARAAPDGWRHIVCTGADTALDVVVKSSTHPTPDQATLVELVSEHARTAIASASARAALSTQQIRAANMHELAETVQKLRRESHVRAVLSQLSTSLAGDLAIAEALNELTGLDVGMEDAFGNLRVNAPPSTTRHYRRIGGHNHTDVVREAISNGHPMRDGDRLFHVVRPRHDVLGIVFLTDPDRVAGDFERFALEHGATALAMQMTHQRSIAEAEIRLRRDLGADLLEGMDNDTACARADALGYDLRKPQRVFAMRWNVADSGAVVAAFGRHIDSTGNNALLARRNDLVAAIAEAATDAHMVYDAMQRTLGVSGVIGVGTIAAEPAAIPRSYADALRALDIRENALRPEGVVHFEKLGVYRILDTQSDSGNVHEFVREWLGDLLDYDRRHHSTMIETLTQYLECGGHYDDTARALRIHRSTLRYRMSRIHELTGRDLHDVDTRLNLHLAARALQVINGSTNA
ncbi:PucR family transcriptional regulator [Rhodococcus sp. NPDC058521]|uniref:PucR family transcriptional regulator n=1 Tax=Rhodococcus sp. NPDC058521 TaxID=3346536 RepID=UPI0036595CC2